MGKSFEDSLISDISGSFKTKDSTARASYLWESSTEVKDWISTGDFMLDLILSNRLDGGVPVGRLTEISGGEAAGKTLLASYILANTQKKGGVAIFIDTEHAASKEVLERSGVDLSKLIYIQAGTTEEVFQAMETIVEKVKKENTDKIITIVWDSVAATSTKAEIEGDYGDKTIALQARLIGQGLRKYIPICSQHKVCLVFINQIRTKIGVTFGDNKTTPGGKAIPFHASVRMRLGHFKEIRDGNKDLVGRIVKCEIKKNKVAPPMRNIFYTIHWGSGLGAWIDSSETMWESAVKANVFERVNNLKYKMKTSTGDYVEFTKKTYPDLVKEESFLKELKIALANAYIVTERSMSSEDVSIEDAEDDI